MYRKFPGVHLEEVLFFLNTPWQGVDTRMVKKFIQQVIMNPLIMLAICIILRLLKRNLRKFFTFILFITAFFISFFYIYLFCSTLLRAFFTHSELSLFYEEHYVDPQKAHITFGKAKKNLIFIGVESLEKTFSNKMFFGQSLIPDLENLEGTRFLAYTDGYATAFTQGSWIAVFTGLPSSYYSSALINVVGKQSFAMQLRNIYSLGKILKDNDYQTIFIQGTDGAFSGTRVFMQNQGIKEFIDKEVISAFYPEFEIGGWGWGYEDADIFKVLKDKINNMSHDKPYALFMATIDTHGFNKLECPMENKFNNPYLNAIYHTNQLVADFVKWFEKRAEYKDTVIIIVGDHLRHGTDFAMPQSRQIYNLFINAPKVKTTSRMFTQIDMFPTVLEAMGANVEGHALGLGISVFSDKKTLIEEMGRKKLNTELQKKNKLYEKLWNN